MSFQMQAEKNVCFTVEANPNSTDPALGVFGKYVNVYGCSVYAESAIPDSMVLHAANVMAELLDNNEDGVVDDQLLFGRISKK